MSMLTLVFFLVSLFIGRGKGLALYGGWMVLAWFIDGKPTMLFTADHAAVMIASCLLIIASIMVQRWTGLILFVVGFAAITISAACGLL